MESFLGWIVESSLLVLLIIGIRKLFMGKIRYSLIYALWGVVMLRFLVPVNFVTTPMSVSKLVSGAFSAQKTFNETEQETESIKNTDDGINQNAGAKVIFAAESVSGEKQGYGSQKQDDIGVGNAQLHSELAVTPQKVNESREEADRGGSWKYFCRVWIVGAVVFLWWMISSNVSMLRKLKRDRVLYGVRDNIEIYLVSGIKTPCLYGFIRPAIYLPAALVMGESGEGIDGEELGQIITHEFVHYRHGDHIWAMFRILLVSVYWFDPFVWVASAFSKKDAELFCDETVLNLLGDEKRFCYGGMLVKLAGDTRFGDFRYSMMPVSRKGKDMEKRIRAISEKKRYSKWILIPLAAVLAIALALTCSAGVTLYAKGSNDKKNVAGNGISDGKTSIVSAKKADASEINKGYTIDEQISAYSDFLKENAGKSDCRYYSLGRMSDNHVVLMITNHVMDNVSGTYASSFCQVYNIIDGKVAYCGDMACSSSGEYVHISDDGKIMTDTHHSVTSAVVEVNSNKLIEDTIEEAKAADGSYSGDGSFFDEFAKAATVVFYTNPYIGKKIGRDSPKAMSLQDNSKYYMIYDHGYDFIFEGTDGDSASEAKVEEEEMVSAVYADSPEAAFELYIKTFTDAVNSGDIGKLHQSLYVNSDVYEQQCDIVKNYHKRGISETVKSVAILSEKKKGDLCVEVISKEKIKVSYADKSSKLVKQSYCYTCEYIDNTWVITKMEDVG